MRRLTMIAAAVLCCAVVAPVGPEALAAPSAVALQAEVNEHIAKVNQIRAQRGLRPLVADPTLQAGAQRWSEAMASAGQISHDPNPGAGVTIPYETIDESVAYGPNTDYIINGLVNDPPHLELMTKPGHTLIGVGVAWRGGTQYAVHRYLTPASSKPQPPPPPPSSTSSTTATSSTAPPLQTVPPIPVTDPWPVDPDGSTQGRRGARTLRQSDLFNFQFRLLLQRGGSSTGPLVYPGGTTSPSDPVVLPVPPRSSTSSTTSSSSTTSVPSTVPPSRSTTATYDDIRHRLLGLPVRNRPILLVHGINVFSDSTDCGDAFNEMIDWLGILGFSGPMIKVGYYTNDVNCDVNLHDYGTYGDSDSWREIGKAFSRYIEQEWTSEGQTVDVVGYSMGGLITRAAVYGSSSGADGYARPIAVEDVVTLGTPHKGATLGWWCFSGYQCATLARGHADIAWVNQNGNPQAQGGQGGTEWTNIGSHGDYVVDTASATSMRIPATQKKIFNWVVQKSKQSEPFQVSHTGDTNYMHVTVVIRRAASGLALPGS